MTYMNLDSGLTPSDVGDPYDGDKEERLIESIKKHYKPEQIFDYHQLEFWALANGWILPDNNTQIKDY